MESEKEIAPEIKEKSIINLSAVNFEFLDDNGIEDYYKEKLSEIEDKEKWIKENEEKLSQNKAKILKVIEDGIIPDDCPETIWQYKYDDFKKGAEKVLIIKKELEDRIEDIKKIVAERLSRFLPDWNPDKITISFVMDEQRDFCVDKGVVRADLGRLVFKKDFFENVAQGITHEVFHIWMSEKSNWSDSEQDKSSDEELRSQIIFRTIDEGLAVLIGGSSIKRHHERKGRDYDKFIQESFSSFNNFTSTKDRAGLEKIKSEEFKDVGHFYVVGYEMAQVLLNEYGIEKFRELIKTARKNSSKVIEQYKTICVNKPELPKIE